MLVGAVLVMQQHSGILKKYLEEISPFCGAIDNIPWFVGVSKSHFSCCFYLSPLKKFWEDNGDLRMVFCLPVSAV